MKTVGQKNENLSAVELKQKITWIHIFWRCSAW